MGVYVQAGRYAAHAEPDAVLGRLLRGQGATLRFRDWLESRTTPPPGDRDRTADRVAALEDDATGQPWLVVHEFQAQHDPDKLDVTLVEAARLRTEARHGPDRLGKYNVLIGFVYLVGECPKPALDMRLPGGGGTLHAPLIWNVANESAHDALEEVATNGATWGMLFWVPLMAGGGEPETIERWKLLARTLPERRHRDDLGQIALVFAELAGRYLAWEKALEDWEMTESKVVNRWIEKAREETRLETCRRILVKQLKHRFPGLVTAEVIQTIEQQPSETMLEEWLLEATSVETFKEFVTHLRR